MTSAQRAPGSREPIDVALAHAARGQYGLITRAHALRLGATNASIYRRLRSGRWELVFPTVYRLAGTAPSWEQRLLGACLAPGEGAVASHRAAARHWELTGCTNDGIEISLPRERRRILAGVIVHRPGDLARVDRTVRKGIPVTTPTRTLIDLAAVARIDTIEEALDDALRRRLTSLRHLERRLVELARNGRPGIAALRSLLTARTSGDALPESRFETRLLRALMRSGLPRPIPQYRIVDRGRLVARVDFAYPDVKLAIEADGYRYHAGRARFESDRARLNALTALGWRVIHVTWAQLRDEPDTVVTTIGRALGHG